MLHSAITFVLLRPVACWLLRPQRRAAANRRAAAATMNSRLHAARSGRPSAACLHARQQQHARRRAAVAVRADAAAAAAASGPAAVVSGCSSGIGQQTALLLAQKGWRVFAGARADRDLQQLAQLHERITPLQLDVSSDASISAAAQRVCEALGPGGSLSLLVNNAGVGVVAPAETIPLGEFKRVFDVNVFGALALSQALLPLLRAGPGPSKGRIINISSVAGHLSLPFWSAYNASKAALEALSDSMRYELVSQGIAVVLVKPGPVSTPIWATSRARSEALVERMSDDAQQLYAGPLKAMREQVARSEEGAIPVEDVAALLYEAATTPQPASRYHIGEGALTSHWARRLLPDGVWDGLLLRGLGPAFERPRSS